MGPDDIAYSLSLVGEELAAMNVNQPVKFLMIGGGYMLTQIGNRTFTTDIDGMVLEPDVTSERYRLFKEAVKFVGQDLHLHPAWLSTNIGDFLVAAGIVPPGILWQQFGPLEIYIPPMDFILAHKIVASRQKDEDDIQALCDRLGVTTKKKAQALVNKYITQETQRYHQVPQKLKKLFG